MEFQWFGSNTTTCLLGVDLWGRIGRVQLPALAGTLAASVWGDSPSQFPRSVAQIWGAQKKQSCSVGSQEKSVLQEESSGGLRPLLGLDMLLHASSHSLPERGKGEGAEPTHSRQGSVCADGWISWRTGTSGVLQQPGEVREVKEEALYFKWLYVIEVRLNVLKRGASDTNSIWGTEEWSARMLNIRVAVLLAIWAAAVDTRALCLSGSCTYAMSSQRIFPLNFTHIK